MKKILVLAMCLYAGVQASEYGAHAAIINNDLPWLRSVYHDHGPNLLTTRIGSMLLQLAKTVEIAEFLINGREYPTAF